MKKAGVRGNALPALIVVPAQFGRPSAGRLFVHPNVVGICREVKTVISHSAEALNIRGLTVMHELLIQAIRERMVLTLYYEPGERIIEPHAYGLSAEGKPLLRAFQTAGASASGEHENWKLFRVDRIKTIAPQGGSFGGPRPEYRRDDRAMKRRIYEQL